MTFKFTDKAECMDVKLEQINGDSLVHIELIEFRKSSAKNIEDILRNGVKGRNQDLEIDTICLSKDNFSKLSSYRYKASFNTLIDIGDNTVKAATFTLGNVELRFNNNHVEYNGDGVIISSADMIAYPYGHYSFEELK